MHAAAGQFWASFNVLPIHIQDVAKGQFELLKVSPHHPSLHLKRVGAYWSVRVNQDYRALGIDHEDGILWFWIGNHRAYEKLIA